MHLPALSTTAGGPGPGEGTGPECYTSKRGTRRVVAAMNHPSCPHKRTRLIAQDADTQYTECLDCGEILDSEDSGKPGEPKELPATDGSLSDA